MSSLPSDFFFLVEKIDIYLFKLFVRIYLLLYDCNLMLSDGEYNLLTYLVVISLRNLANMFLSDGFLYRENIFQIA